MFQKVTERVGAVTGEAPEGRVLCLLKASKRRWSLGGSLGLVFRERCVGTKG